MLLMQDARKVIVHDVGPWSSAGRYVSVPHFPILSLCSVYFAVRRSQLKAEISARSFHLLQHFLLDFSNWCLGNKWVKVKAVLLPKPVLLVVVLK